MSKNAPSLLFFLALAILPVAARALPLDVRDIAVTIHRDGEAFVVDVNFLVQCTAQEAWDVLTDYDHMARFVSNLAMSRIVRRDLDRIEVVQTSRLGFGPFQFNFENAREIELVALQEIHSTLIRGDMKASSFTTRLSAEGSATRVTNHGRFTPDRWVPPLIGVAVLEAEARKQFAELRAEILRRKSAAQLTHPGSLAPT